MSSRSSRAGLFALLRSLAPWMLVVSACASGSWPAAAAANVVVFDTFGPADSYNGAARYSPGQAFLFEPTQSGLLANVSVALGRTSTSTTQTRFDLYTDANLGLGTFLESFVIPNTTPPLPAAGAVVTFDSAVHPTLQSGQAYWLFFSDPGPLTSSSLWFFNDQGISGPRLAGSTTIATLPAFRVEVVAEPSAGVLLLLAAPALLPIWRAGRHAHRRRE